MLAVLAATFECSAAVASRDVSLSWENKEAQELAHVASRLRESRERTSNEVRLAGSAWRRES